MNKVEVNIKRVTYNDEIFYHSFYKEDGKVQAFSVMTEIKGK